MGTTYTRKQPVHYDVDDRDDLYETRTPSSARRYRPTNTVDNPTDQQRQNSTTLVQRRRSSATTTTNMKNTTSRKLTPGSTTPQETSSTPRVTASVPRVTGSTARMTGKTPRITGSTPRTTGNTSRLTGTTPAPRMIGATPRMTGSGSTTAMSAVKNTSRVVNTRSTRQNNAYPVSANQRFFIKALIIGMIATVVLLVGFTLLSGWWQNFHNNLLYGYPRTSQLDAVVGQGDSTSNPTHFLFINLHGQIEVIEMQGGDPAHTRIFTGPKLYGPNADLIPVTGQTEKDAKTGRTDILVHAGSEGYLFVNTGSSFQPESQTQSQ
ncbi:MAG TPA: hypothetical protein VL461_14030 [Dictyobacter sp.]|jgi:hypothetical protein|nr:hypothetical protein [Dictyobacter sp.]